MAKGKWLRRGGEWTCKAFAEQDVDKLRERGYEARLKSTKKRVKTPFGTISGQRWFAEIFWPEEAVDFRKGRWVKYRDPNNKSLDLENLIPVDGEW